MCSSPDFNVFMPKLSIAHIQTFVCSCADYRVLMSRLSCFYVQTIKLLPFFPECTILRERRSARAFAFSLGLQSGPSGTSICAKMCVFLLIKFYLTYSDARVNWNWNTLIIRNENAYYKSSIQSIHLGGGVVIPLSYLFCPKWSLVQPSLICTGPL